MEIAAEFQIVPMVIDDYDEVLALWQRTEGMGLDLEDADSREGFTLYLRRNPGMCFTARVDGQLAGTALCGHDGRRGYLTHLAVAPEFRRRGIGSALIDRCLAMLRAEGIARCNIFVFADNETGRCFWERRGWMAYPNVTLMQTVTDSAKTMSLLAGTGGEK